MKLFNTLALELTSDCNRRCEFCPVAYNTRPVEAMPLLYVETAADELASMRYRGRVEFYIYNEPLKNRDALLAALDAFRMRAPAVTTMVATNGDYLHGPEDIELLFARGLQQLILNAYSAKQYPRFKEWAAHFPGTSERSVYSALPRGKRAIQVLDKSKPEAFGKGVFQLQNRAGTVPQFMSPTAQPLQRMCTKPFRLLNINWRGEALVCCNDYHGDVVVGHYPDTGLRALWNSPVLNAYRKHLLDKDRSLPMCRVCDCHSGAYPHNVDKEFGDAASDEDIEQAYRARVAARNG